MQDTVFGHRSMLIAVVIISIILIYYRHHYHRLDCSSSLDRKLLLREAMFPVRVYHEYIMMFSFSTTTTIPHPTLPTHTHTNTRFPVLLYNVVFLSPAPSDLLVEYIVYLYHQYHMFLPFEFRPDITAIKWLTGRKTPSYYFSFELLIDLICPVRFTCHRYFLFLGLFFGFCCTVLSWLVTAVLSMVRLPCDIPQCLVSTV